MVPDQVETRRLCTVTGLESIRLANKLMHPRWSFRCRLQPPFPRHSVSLSLADSRSFVSLSRLSARLRALIAYTQSRVVYLPYVCWSLCITARRNLAGKRLCGLAGDISIYPSEISVSPLHVYPIVTFTVRWENFGNVRTWVPRTICQMRTVYERHAPGDLGSGRFRSIFSHTFTQSTSRWCWLNKPLLTRLPACLAVTRNGVA